MTTEFNASNKRKCGYNESDQSFDESDGTDGLVKGINGLSIEQVSSIF